MATLEEILPTTVVGGVLPGRLVTVVGAKWATARADVAVERRPRRYHATVPLDSSRTGRDASRIADEVIAHLAGLVGANVRVTLEIEADIPDGVPENVVRTVTENGNSLKFTSQGFESE